MSEQTDEREEKAYFSARLKNTLALDGNPVAVGFVSKVPKGTKKYPRRATLCLMIQSARRDASFYSSGESIICNGKAHVGIGNSPIWDLEDFLVRRERIVGSKTAARRMLDLAKEHASQLGRYIIFSPLGQANFQPDVVVFVGTPLQISRILFLDAYETGEINTLHREPLCSGVIATPIATRQIGISFLDMACRSLGQYRPEEMGIGVPYYRVPKIVESVDRSVAGTAKSNFFLRLLPKMMNSDWPGQPTP